MISGSLSIYIAVHALFCLHLSNVSLQDSNALFLLLYSCMPYPSSFVAKILLQSLRLFFCSCMIVLSCSAKLHLQSLRLFFCSCTFYPVLFVAKPHLQSLRLFFCSCVFYILFLMPTHLSYMCIIIESKKGGDK